MFQVNISKNRATTIASELLTYGQVGAQVYFTFSDDWTDLKKTAIFKRCGKTCDVLESQWDNNVVTIPPEMTQLIGATVRVGIYGRNDSGKRVTPTVYTNLSIVAAAADPSGDETTDPSLPVWSQLQGELNKAVQIVPQDFTDDEKAQARENIQAGPILTDTRIRTYEYPSLVYSGKTETATVYLSGTGDLLPLPADASDELALSFAKFIYGVIAWRNTYRGIQMQVDTAVDLYKAGLLTPDVNIQRRLDPSSVIIKTELLSESYIRCTSFSAQRGTVSIAKHPETGAYSWYSIDRNLRETAYDGAGNDASAVVSQFTLRTDPSSDMQPATKHYVDAGDVQPDWTENDPTSKAYIKNRIGGYDRTRFDAYTISMDDVNGVYISSLNVELTSTSGADWLIGTIAGTVGTCTVNPEFVGKTLRVLEDDSEILSITPTIADGYEFPLQSEGLEAGHSYIVEIDGVKYAAPIRIPSKYTEPHAVTLAGFMVPAFTDAGAFVTASMNAESTDQVRRAMRAKLPVAIFLAGTNKILYPAAYNVVDGYYWFSSDLDQADSKFYVARLSLAGAWTCTYQRVINESQYDSLSMEVSALAGTIENSSVIPKLQKNVQHGVAAPVQRAENDAPAWTRILPVVYYNAVDNQFTDAFKNALTVSDLAKYYQFLVINMAPAGTVTTGYIDRGIGTVYSNSSVKYQIRIYGFREVRSTGVLTPTRLDSNTDLTPETTRGYTWTYYIPQAFQITSPNGTVFNITIDDNGNLTAAAT